MLFPFIFATVSFKLLTRIIIEYGFNKEKGHIISLSLLFCYCFLRVPMAC